ncbi:hypothetical protein LEMLEM_LOCUS14772 [Lemmus lemmus]
MEEKMGCFSILKTTQGS